MSLWKVGILIALWRLVPYGLFVGWSYVQMWRERAR